MTANYNEEVVKPGDRASRLAKEICYRSHRNNPAITVLAHQPNNFRGPVGFAWKKHILKQMMEYVVNAEGEIVYWTMCEEVENDGAGGKPQFFTLVGTREAFYRLAWEIIVMTADDFVRTGRFPVVIDNEVQAKYITDENFPLFEAMMQGYGAALRESALVNITGEVAIMKHSITAFCDQKSDDQLILTWGASCVGLAHKDLLFDINNVRPDMFIVGFWEPGYRCNGGTFFTDLIMSTWGPSIKDIYSQPEAMEFARKLTVPSLSYAPTISGLLGWDKIISGERIGDVAQGRLADIIAIAHITGGGVWEKFSEILPEGIGANLSNMPEPAEVLLLGQALSKRLSPSRYLSDYQAYGTLHGGCGLLMIVRSAKDAQVVIEEAGKDGIQGQIVGRTTEDKDGIITINSRFGEGGLLFSNQPN